jgi:hypothetical protein
MNTHMQPLDPSSPWPSRLPRLAGSDPQRPSFYALPPPELEPEPLDDPANLLPFPPAPPSPPSPVHVDLPW